VTLAEIQSPTLALAEIRLDPPPVREPMYEAVGYVAIFVLLAFAAGRIIPHDQLELLGRISHWAASLFAVIMIITLIAESRDSVLQSPIINRVVYFTGLAYGFMAMSFQGWNLKRSLVGFSFLITGMILRSTIPTDDAVVKDEWKDGIKQLRLVAMLIMIFVLLVLAVSPSKIPQQRLTFYGKNPNVPPPVTEVNRWPSALLGLALAGIVAFHLAQHSEFPTAHCDAARASRTATAEGCQTQATLSLVALAFLFVIVIFIYIANQPVVPVLTPAGVAFYMAYVLSLATIASIPLL